MPTISLKDTVTIQVNGASVSVTNPIPVTLANGPSGVAAVSGTFTSTENSSTFTPIPGREFNVSVYGTFGATVQLKRSLDGGTTWLAITANGTTLYSWSGGTSVEYSETAEEPQYGALYRLQCTWTSGTVNYRISQ